MYISKRSFEDSYFKDMVAAHDAKAKTLTTRMVKHYVRAEFCVFLSYLSYFMADKQAHAKGNAFAQAIHDGGTLANKKKFRAFAVQFVDSQLRLNFVICIEFVRCQSSTSEAVAQRFKALFLNRTGLNLMDVTSSMVQDNRAAKVEAGVLGQEEEVCGMHDGTWPAFRYAYCVYN